MEVPPQGQRVRNDNAYAEGWCRTAKYSHSGLIDRARRYN